MSRYTPAEGFRNTRYWRFDALDKKIGSLELMLPTTVPENFSEQTRENAFLQEESAATAVAVAAAAVAETQMDDSTKKSSQRDDSRKTSGFRSAGPAKHKSSGELTLEEAQNILELVSVESAAQVPSGHVMVYKRDEPTSLVSQTRTPDKDQITRNKKIFDVVSKVGNTRPVASIPRREIVATCEKLESVHPNFVSVIAAVRKEMLLSIVRKKPMRISPLLLIGPPGVGKTHFAKALATALKTSMVSLSFDAGLTSGALLGTDRHWANTNTGKVFDAVVMGKHANPVLVLDEIDKANVDARGQQHPLASLHSLLEPVSSRSVTDISVEFTFDASHVIWIATANYPDRIPHTLRSRFSEHFVTDPTAAQALELAKVMLLAVHKDMAIPNFHKPAMTLAKHIAHLSAREMRQAIEQAYASAIETDRSQLCAVDFDLDDDFQKSVSDGHLTLH